MKNLSLDEWHETWLAEMSCLTWGYMSKKSATPCKGHVLSLIGDDLDFECNGIIDLPPGSGKLIQKMAGFSQCTLFKPRSIQKSDLKDFPQNTFCLNSLLLAAFPKNSVTNVFKAHDCAVSVGALPSPEGGFRVQYCVFGGLGVILMAECRRMLSPLAPDQDIINLVDGKFLSVIE
jgi:hypothetical protein